jgi:hypothetical protein
VIDFGVRERTLRHRGIHRIRRILHHGNAVLLLDREHPGRAVIERAGEHNRDHRRTGGNGCAAKQRVHRRPGTVLARTAGKVQRAVARDQQMPVGRRDVHHSRLIPFSVLGRLRRDRSLPVEDLCEKARRVGRDVQHDAHRGREVGREVAHESPQCVDAARRRADDDNPLFF